MKNNLFRRSLVYGIVLLFIGLGVTSSIGGYTEKISNQSTEEALANFPLNRGLLANWKFDEGSGDTAGDSSGHGYDGTIYGAAWTTGHSGTALDFDGVDDYVDLDAHSENLGVNKTDNYVISVMVKTTSTGPGVVYCMSHTIGERVYVDLILSEGYFVFRLGTEECVLNVTTDTYNDGSWHNVECVYYGSVTDPTLEIYVDGDLEDSVTKWQCPFSNLDFHTAKMGRKSHDSIDYFDGVIDEVEIYKSTTGNQAPGKPTITGPDEVKKGEQNEYTFRAVDPDGDDLFYWIDWDDGNIENWIGPYPNDTDVKVKHTWSNEGEVTITAKAKDHPWGAEGPINTKKVTVPKNKALDFNFNLLEWLFEQFPNAFPIIKILLGL